MVAGHAANDSAPAASAAMAADATSMPLHVVQPGMSREKRFEAALRVRVEGKGVKSGKGCASAQLNRECKEGTRTPEYAKLMEVARATTDAEILGQFGTNASSFDRPDFLQAEKPLSCALWFTRVFVRFLLDSSVYRGLHFWLTVSCVGWAAPQLPRRLWRSTFSVMRGNGQCRLLQKRALLRCGGSCATL
jgi:hypothetical protein